MVGFLGLVLGLFSLRAGIASNPGRFRRTPSEGEKEKN